MFLMVKMFGTDGIRGEYGKPPITPAYVFKIGSAFGSTLIKHNPEVRSVVIIRDTRASGIDLQNALVEGIRNVGLDVIIAGILPTPAIIFLMNDLNADAGIVISASHNPYDHNGLKFFTNEGFKLSDDLEREIEDVFGKDNSSDNAGKAYLMYDSVKKYVEFLKKSLSHNLSGMRLVVDSANGATYAVSKIFMELGADVVRIGCTPDGFNINDNCGALHPEEMAKKVVECKADFGIALDGDGDRIIMCDEFGNIVDGDDIVGILASNLKLNKNKVVLTVMSNVGLKKFLESKGISYVETKVGDKYVIEEMREQGLNIGGEQSGHIIMMDYSTTGDGMMTGLQVARIVKNSGKPLSELCKGINKFPQVLINVEVDEKRSFDRIPGLNEAINDAALVLGSSGRVLVRYSGTESLVRVMVEGRDKKQISEIAQKIASRFCSEEKCRLS